MPIANSLQDGFIAVDAVNVLCGVMVGSRFNECLIIIFVSMETQNFMFLYKLFKDDCVIGMERSEIQYMYICNM